MPSRADGPFRVLLLEGLRTDAEVIGQSLKSAEIDCVVKHVDSPEAFGHALARFDADLVLVADTVADLPVEAALGLVRTEHPTTPAIAVTDHVPAETIGAFFEAGADDHVLKDDALRLGAAVRAALARRARRLAMGADPTGSQSFFRVSADGKLLFANPALAELLRYDSADEVLGLDLPREVFAEPPGPGVFDEPGTQQPEETEARWRRKNGSVIDVRLRSQEVRDEEGDITHYDVVAEDVTSRRHLERQLRGAQALQALGQLTSGVAHDIANLLSVIITNTQLLAERVADDEETRRLIAEIGDAAAAAGDLLHQLLGIGRVAPDDLEVLDLTVLLRRLSEMLRRVLPETIVTEFASEGEIPLVMAHPGAVEQVILNLVMNARDAMPAGGTLRIEISANSAARDEAVGDAVRVRVRDTGTGMSAETLERAFDPFFTTKAPGQGVGLGLPMVRATMQQLGGAVEIDSQPGSGTTVTLTFRAARDARPAERKEPPPRDPRGAETVLLVEDQELVRRAATRALERYGYRVLTASDGRTGLQTFRTHAAEIALVLADCVMPGLGGAELARAVRAMGSQIPVILSTGYALPEDHETVFGPQTGITLLPKPWSLEDLIGAIREALDHHAPPPPRTT